MGVKVYVPEKYYSRFMVFEDDLRDLGISYKEYAYVAMKMLAGWARERKMNTIPIRTFAGNWALDMYLEVRDSQQVTIQIDDVDVVLESEVLVGRKYIQDSLNGFTRLRDVVGDIRPLLDDDWIRLYESGEARPIRDAVKVLSFEFGVPGASTYTEIVDKLI